VSPGEAPAYDCSKAAGESAIRELVKQGLDAVIVHPSGIIGPFDFRPSRMGTVFLDLYHRKLPSLLDGGFDWVDVRDVVTGSIAAMERGRTNESYLLTGTWRSIGELATMAEAITGVRPPRFTSPPWLARIGAPFMEGWAKLTRQEPLYTAESLVALRANKVYLRDKSERELGYRPRPTEESVRETYRWFAASGRLPAALLDRIDRHAAAAPAQVSA
jgi:dihydroflavonol-4-reductase